MSRCTITSASFSLDVTYPFTLAVEAKDFTQDSTGLEHIGTDRQQMGDGGLIFQAVDTSTGDVLAGSDGGRQALVTNVAPLNTSCEKSAQPEVDCEYSIVADPDGWTGVGYDDSSHGPARPRTPQPRWGPRTATTRFPGTPPRPSSGSRTSRSTTRSSCATWCAHVKGPTSGRGTRYATPCPTAWAPSATAAPGKDPPERPDARPPGISPLQPGVVAGQAVRPSGRQPVTSTGGAAPPGPARLHRGGR